jgi:CRISPR-associated protein Cmr3
MSVWLIEPRDPIIFRDGKPFNPTPGVRAISLPFPYPSTLAGAVRTRAGQDGNGVFDTSRIDELLQVEVRGPILAEVGREGRVVEYLFPAPADCFVIEAGDDEKQGRRLWARPVEMNAGEQTNLKDNLKLVSVNPASKDKAHSKAPHYWKWDELRKWLAASADDQLPVVLKNLGISGLTMESRLHVSINPQTGTALGGALFQTSGLEFARVEEEKLSGAKQFALAVETDVKNLSEGVDFLGGERRMIAWRQSSAAFPECPDEIKQAILTSKHCRLLLATPAIFAAGHLPTWIGQFIPGLTVTIVAAVVPRYQAVSGWDYVTGKPKASRRLAPARSVYFLELNGSEADIEKFVGAVWMQNVSDEEQDRRDGFGLALLGTWDGNIEPLRLEDEK